MAGRKRGRLAVALGGSQRGDTIVSILLSIAVITLVIVLAYTLVSQSLRRGQAAREREQVKNLIQSQIEGLKNLAARGEDDVTLNIFHDDYDEDQSGVPFCLEEDGTITKDIRYRKALSSTPGSSTFPSVDQTDDCETFGLELENLWIIYDSADSASNEQHLFTVRADWVSAVGGQESTLSVPVRIHPLDQ